MPPYKQNSGNTTAGCHNAAFCYDKMAFFFAAMERFAFLECLIGLRDAFAIVSGHSVSSA